MRWVLQFIGIRAGIRSMRDKHMIMIEHVHLHTLAYNIFLYDYRIPIRREETADLHSMAASHQPQRDQPTERVGSPAHSHAQHAPHEQIHLEQHEQEVHGPHEYRERRYDKLRKQGAVDFSGTTDPSVAETWLKRTQRVLNQMRCTPEEKFDYAVSLLQGNAYAWWETVPGNDVQPPVLTWDDFLREFSNNYMPEVYRDDKRREFLNLKQGTMTVAEYEVKFNQLSHYASSLVATDRDKCRMFEEGLRYELREKLTPADLESYTKLKAAVIKAERLVKEGS